MEEVRNWKTLDLISAIKKWNIDKVRCKTVERGSRRYKSGNSAKVNVESLNYDDSYDQKENISENEYEDFLVAK